jgi:hypothetical protein
MPPPDSIEEVSSCSKRKSAAVAHQRSAPSPPPIGRRWEIPDATHSTPGTDVTDSTRVPMAGRFAGPGACSRSAAPGRSGRRRGRRVHRHRPAARPAAPTTRAPARSSSRSASKGPRRCGPCGSIRSRARPTVSSIRGLNRSGFRTGEGNIGGLLILDGYPPGPIGPDLTASATGATVSVQYVLLPRGRHRIAALVADARQLFVGVAAAVYRRGGSENDPLRQTPM